MLQQNSTLKNAVPNVGAIPDHFIKQFMDERLICNGLHGNINPSSLDLQVNMETLCEVPCMFIPSKKNHTIAHTLNQISAKRIVPNQDGYLLKTGKVYVAEIIEDIHLPPDFFARANPKSSTGRSDVHVRLMTDFTAQYDSVWGGSRNNKMKSYVIIRPQSFDICFPKDVPVTMNQLRIFKNDLGLLLTDELQHLSETEENFLVNQHKNKKIIFSNPIKNGQIEMSLDLRDWGGVDDCLGFIAKKNVKIPLIWESKMNNASDFFEPIPKILDDRAFVLEALRFYILSSRESIHIPRAYACEMVSFNDSRGELRAHYAGFIDNGWGSVGGPRPLTLEVRAFEDTYVYHGQPITSVVLHHMYAPVQHDYDQKGTSNYMNQKTAKLGKFFK